MFKYKQIVSTSAVENVFTRWALVPRSKILSTDKIIVICSCQTRAWGPIAHWPDPFKTWNLRFDQNDGLSNQVLLGWFIFDNLKSHPFIVVSHNYLIDHCSCGSYLVSPAVWILRWGAWNFSTVQGSTSSWTGASGFAWRASTSRLQQTVLTLMAYTS